MFDQFQSVWINQFQSTSVNLISYNQFDSVKTAGIDWEPEGGETTREYSFQWAPKITRTSRTAMLEQVKNAVIPNDRQIWVCLLQNGRSLPQREGANLGAFDLCHVNQLKSFGAVQILGASAARWLKVLSHSLRGMGMTPKFRRNTLGVIKHVVAYPTSYQGGMGH